MSGSQKLKTVFKRVSGWRDGKEGIRTFLLGKIPVYAPHIHMQTYLALLSDALI